MTRLSNLRILMTADAVGGGWRAVETADQPSDEALLALAASLCNKPDPE